MSEEKKDEILEQETVETKEEIKTEEDEQKTESLEEKVARLESELKESEEKFLRAYADFENMKKRLEKEKYQAIDYASEKFAKDLLTPLDTLEMALNSAKADVDANELLEKLKEGIELTLKNFIMTFEKHNITKVETDGEFDPNVHNAVMQVDSAEHNSGQIVQELQKGYVLKDRLLRPSMVSIAN
ncbi:nucleotide exchange factor GrpE [Aliarcobacter butzleri]|uniref:nucleotide exchange factor GrpE n=1 Tax=Aliarcobacter butzleri TaxID=28197 RepID=UPI002B24A2AA|nr:nucleotide exchange factor GrpE [Aliarcobacter butzleri]